MAEAVKWGQRGARLNDIAPGIVVTPLAIDEFNGPRGDFIKICLQTVLPGVREPQMKLQMLRNF